MFDFEEFGNFWQYILNHESPYSWRKRRDLMQSTNHLSMLKFMMMTIYHRLVSIMLF
jgi:hypothetical protein